MYIQNSCAARQQDWLRSLLLRKEETERDIQRLMRKVGGGESIGVNELDTFSATGLTHRCHFQED